MLSKEVSSTIFLSLWYDSTWDWARVSRTITHKNWILDKFTYQGSSVSSTETNINTQLALAWTAIDKLSAILKSDLANKMKRSFFQAAIVSILLYGCTTWTLTKRMEKKLDGNYTRMLRAIMNKSWRQHPTKQQLYCHLPPITKTIRVRRTKYAGHCWRSRDELIRDVLLWTPSHGRAKVNNNLTSLLSPFNPRNIKPNILTAHSTASLQNSKARSSPQRVSCIWQNNLIVRLQSWRFWECGVHLYYHYSQVHA